MGTVAGPAHTFVAGGGAPTVTPRVYYNDSEPFVCDWLENLIREKLLPDGVVDRRPIQEVQPSDVQAFTQCHFFAGIGGWAYALQLAGWGDRPVWTGSCPCQPFSAAGKQEGHDDVRHLWPIWHDLIAERQPATVFGEQVSSTLGRSWLAAVRADLEALGYAVGGADLCAASVGAPHIRQRLYFVADDEQSGLERHAGHERDGHEPGREHALAAGPVGEGGESGELAHAADAYRGERRDASRSANSGHPVGAGWSGCIQIPCRDGKVRPIPAEPGLFPLVDAGSIRNRVALLRGAGNAIVPQVAAAFVSAYLECVG